MVLLHKTSWLDQNLSNCTLKQLSDDTSTTKDGKEFHNSFDKKYFLMSYLATFLATYTYYV